jgi:glutaminyl-peptide cyclotransferase
MRSRALAIAALAALLAGCGGSDETPGSDRFDAARAFRDLRAQVRIGPRPAGSPGARAEVGLIRRRLAAAGVGGVTVQRPHRNVVATIPGRERGVVVVGAHYDTKDLSGFVGANDGASGVAVLLELARSLAPRSSGASIQLAFFDAEEARDDRPFERDGTRGSRQFVALARGGRQGSPAIGRIRAMVLFDMVGDCELRIPREAGSDPALYGRFADAARDAFGSSAPFEGVGAPILDDHTPFQRARVPVVDLIDFDYGPGPSPGAWWHTREDDMGKVCAASLDRVGEAAVRAIPALAR